MVDDSLPLPRALLLSRPLSPSRLAVSENQVPVSIVGDEGPDGAAPKAARVARRDDDAAGGRRGTGRAPGGGPGRGRGCRRAVAPQNGRSAARGGDDGAEEAGGSPGHGDHKVVAAGVPRETVVLAAVVALEGTASPGAGGGNRVNGGPRGDLVNHGRGAFCTVPTKRKGHLRSVRREFGVVT